MSAPYPPPGSAPGAAPNNTLGLVSLILGIASIPLACCFYLGLPVGIAAAVMGFMGRQKADQGLATNRPQAQWGLITGIIGAGVAVLLIILVLALNVVNLPTPGA